ncbi:MAG: hypothetical protein KDB64_10955 [Solirubrobacterales bacterium]|nr:hypothetical protein [Solirubrobacterales bacterium]
MTHLHAKAGPFTRVSFLAILLLPFLILTSVDANASPGPWLSPPKPITPDNGEWVLSDPEVAVGPGRTATAAWLGFDPGSDGDSTNGRQIVRISTRPAWGRFAAPVKLVTTPVTSPSGGNLDEVQIAAGKGGTLVTWVGISGDHLVVQGSFRPRGGHLGKVINLSDDPALRLTASAAGPDGTFAVAWVGVDDVVQVAVRKPGHGFSDPVDLSVAGPTVFDLPDLAIDRNGTVSVIWSSADFANNRSELKVAKLPEGNWHGNRVTVARGTTDGTDPIEDPRIAVAPDRSVSLAWRQGPPPVWDQDGAEVGRIYSATRKPGGHFTDPRPVSGASPVGFDNSSPEIAIGGDGVVSIAFLKLLRFRGEDGDGNGIWLWYRVAYVATGNTHLGFHRRAFGGGLEHSATSPGITASTDGSTTVLWSEKRASDPGLGSTLNAATRPPGGIYPRVDRWTTIAYDWVDASSVASSPDGNVVAVWKKLDTEARSILTTSTIPAYCSKVRMKPGRLVRNRDRGVARLAVRVTGRGRLSVVGSGLVRARSVNARRAGTYWLKITPTVPALHKLKRSGTLRVKIDLKFDPRAKGCLKHSRTISVRLKY